jgi:hypothetical protein
MPFVLNGHTQFLSVLQYTSDIIVVPCCMNSTISTSFLSPKQLQSAFLQGRAIAQAISHLLPTAAARVQTRVWSCGIL